MTTDSSSNTVATCLRTDQEHVDSAKGDQRVNVHCRRDQREQRLGLESVRFHDLRHLAATTMVAAGIDPKTVQRRLGHASLHVTLGLYAQATTEADARAAETFDDLMFGTVNASKGECLRRDLRRPR